MQLINQQVAFYAVRMLGLAQHLVLVWLLWRLARRALPGPPRAATFVALASGLNPMLLAMSTSVQNDTLSLVLAVASIDVATAAPDHRRRAIAVGSLAGLALLTKITVWPVVLVLGLCYFLRRRWTPGIIYGLTASAVAGWWFLRNVALYGDLTGRAGVRAAGYTFPPLDGIRPVSLIRSAVTYLWLPTEYVRNLVAAPPLIDVFGNCSGPAGYGLAPTAAGIQG